MAYTEPALPLDVLSQQTIARDQIIWCIDQWLVNFRAAKTIPHAGMVTPAFLRKQTGRGLRNVVTILGGSDGGTSGRISGGSATHWEVLWGWFMVIPGTIQDRSTDASTITGEARRFITATPWLFLHEGLASGSVRITGAPGSVIPVGAIARRNDDFDFVTTAGGAIPGSGALDLDVEAVESGADYNTDPGAVLTLTAPPAGVDPQVTVSDDGLDGGSYESAFAKVPRAGTGQVIPLYKDGDEDLGLSVWLLRWRQEIGLGTARRARTPGPDILTTVTGTSHIAALPNDDEFTQTVEQ